MGKVYLNEIAYKEIKERILLGKYGDNTTSENELVKELNMSRTPIREALQRLEYEGLVKIYSNQGIFFPNPSIKEIHDLFDTRIAIETYSLKKVIQVISAQQLADLDRLLLEQKKAIEDSNTLEFLKGDSEFHSYLIQITDNQFIQPIFTNIGERLFHHGKQVYRKHPDLLKKSFDEHIRIVDMIKDKNSEKAIYLMEQHLLGGKKIELTYV